MKSLMAIKKAFKPYVPIRWTVSFNNIGLNVIDGIFPAKEVNFTEFDPEETPVPVAPGLILNMVTAISPVLRIEIIFYENQSKSIQNKLKEFYSRSSINGVIDLNNPLRCIITEYSRDKSILSHREFSVHLASGLITSLRQDAIPYEAPLTFNVLGEDTNQSDSETSSNA